MTQLPGGSKTATVGVYFSAATVRLHFALPCLLMLAPQVARAEVWSLFHGEVKSLQRRQADLRQKLQALPTLPPPQSHEHAGFHSGFAPTADAARWVQVDLGKEMPLDEVVVIPAYFGATSQGADAYGWPTRFRIEAARDEAFAEPTTLLDATSADQPSRIAPVLAAGNGITARYVRFTATKLAPQPRSYNARYMFCLGELLVFSKGRNAAFQSTVTSTRSLDTPPTWSKSHLVDGWSALGIPALPEPSVLNGWHSGISLSADTSKWVQVDLGTSVSIEEVRLYPAHPPDFPDRPGFGFPRRFRIEMADDDGFSQPRLLADHTKADFPNPADNVVTFKGDGQPGRFVRMTATALWQRNADYVFALAEMEVLSQGKNAARGAPVTFLDQVNTGTWTSERLVDGLAPQGKIAPLQSWLEQLAVRAQLEAALGGLDQNYAQALLVAQKRAGGAGLSLLGLLLLGLGLGAYRGRRARRRELETLRQRIARDLHDEVGSHLGSIALAGELALRREGLDEETRDALEEMQHTARQAAESMRGIVWLVREGGEPSLQRLMQALRDSAAAQLQGTTWDLKVKEPAPEKHASLEFHRHVFLFFKETVHNIARHASATEVRVEAAWTDGELRLAMRDNGRGFDPARKADGSGLSNMKHRATALRGRMELATMPGSGTTVTLIAPLP